MPELEELNAKMYDFVEHWSDGADLDVSGVSLPDCMAYDALSVIGRQLINGPEEPSPPKDGDSHVSAGTLSEVSP